MSLREEILDVSKDLLIEDGFGKMSMRKIAKRANVSATSIYLYFKNKDELLLTLVQQSIESLRTSLTDVMKDIYDPDEQLYILASAYIDYAMEHPREYEIIYMVRPEEMPKYPKEKFDEVRSVYKLISEIFEHGKQTCQLNVEDPLTSAYVVWAQLHGVVSVILNKRLDTRIPEDIFINQSLHQILQSFVIEKTTA